MHSSSVADANKVMDTKPRWADYLNAYMEAPEIFLSPNLSARERDQGFQKIMWHSVSGTDVFAAAYDGDGDGKSDGGVALANPQPVYQGGYGYNFQYLGNARPTPTFHARLGRDVVAESETVAVGDNRRLPATANAANEPGDGGAAVYALDPPLGADRGNGKGHRPRQGLLRGRQQREPHQRRRSRVPVPLRPGRAERPATPPASSSSTATPSRCPAGRSTTTTTTGTVDNGYWNGHADPIDTR